MNQGEGRKGMIIEPEEREKIIFLLKLKNITTIEKFIFGLLGQRDIINIAKRTVNNNGLYFCEYDENGYFIYAYMCRHCGHGQHPQERLCRNKRYFKHRIDCPVLIAKDLLTI